MLSSRLLLSHAASAAPRAQSNQQVLFQQLLLLLRLLLLQLELQLRLRRLLLVVVLWRLGRGA